MYFVGPREKLEELIAILRDDLGLTLLGYKLDNDMITWGVLRGLKDLPVYIEDHVEPGVYRIKPGNRFRHTFLSPKVYLNPAEQPLILESRDFEVQELGPYREEKIAFFGIKPCDLEAIKVLDSILLNKHPVYTIRRNNVKVIIVEDCLEPNNNCFCGIFGTGPTATSGFDIAYARLDENTVLFRAGNELGKGVLSKLGVKLADEKLVSEYYRVVSEALSRMLRGLPVKPEVIAMRLTRSMRDEPLWKKLSEKCVGCGNCNYVCPTCFCLELDYVIENSNLACKIAKWTGCLLYSYGQVALGHFRRELYMRYRHFVLHKFVFYPKQIGRFGCTGCGRCITWCPLGVDIRNTIIEAMR